MEARNWLRPKHQFSGEIHEPFENAHVDPNGFFHEGRGGRRVRSLRGGESGGGSLGRIAWRRSRHRLDVNCFRLIGRARKPPRRAAAARIDSVEPKEADPVGG